MKKHWTTIALRESKYILARSRGDAERFPRVLNYTKTPNSVHRSCDRLIMYLSPGGVYVWARQPLARTVLRRRSLNTKSKFDTYVDITSHLDNL